jgi:hypothetical protein
MLRSFKVPDFDWYKILYPFPDQTIRYREARQKVMKPVPEPGACPGIPIGTASTAGKALASGITRRNDDPIHN